RRGRTARRRLRAERVPARRGDGVPHLAHRRPRHRAAQPHLRLRGRAPLRPAGGLAGLPRRLAAVVHLRQVAELRGDRGAVRGGSDGMNAGTGPETRAHAAGSPDSAGQSSSPPGAGVTDGDRYVASRTVDAAPSAVFALLADPARHHETEPTDWVRSALEPDPAPLTAVGQVRGTELFHDSAGGRHDTNPRVITLDRGRTGAGEPGQHGPDGERGTGGWPWRYVLAPEDERARVTLIYDWSAW